MPAWAAPTPLALPSVDGALLAKAQADECYDGIGTDYPDGPPCATGQSKVNQAYVWGLAKVGDQIWFGTMANTHCLVEGAYLGITSPMETSSYVCEFGQSEIRRLGLPPYLPPNTVPEAIGDFRPPEIYVYDTGTQSLTRKIPPGAAGALLATTIGLRAAGTLNDVVLFAGPGLSGGLNVFAYQASTGNFLGATSLPYNNIRKFVAVDGVLYAGVGTSALPPVKSGRVLRWQGSVASPFAFDEVGILDSMASEIAAHDGHLFVTSWPSGGISGGSFEAGLYMSPAIPAGGFVTPATEWTKVWTVSDYEADPVIAATYGGGALASFQGSLYWGTMHVPFLSTLAVMNQYSLPSDPDQLMAAALASSRAISLFKGSNFGQPSQAIDVLYGYGSMPAYNPGTSSWTVLPNNMGKAPLWGSAGFNNPANNYTWTMAAGGDRLWVGTMDWSWLLSEGLGDAIPDLNLPDITLPGLTTLGADLWYFPSADSPAYPESIDGVGNPSSYGIRNMLAEPGKVYLGMANPMNLLTDPSQGPVGGWELIELAERAPNTPSGHGITVPIEHATSIRFCQVDAPGTTTSAVIPLGELPLDLPNGMSLGNALLIASSADWRGGCVSGEPLAEIVAPRANLQNPRMLQLVWNPATGLHGWRDITTQVTGQSVIGAADAGFMGVIVLASTATVAGIPALSPVGTLLLATLLMGLAVPAVRSLRRGG